LICRIRQDGTVFRQAAIILWSAAAGCGGCSPEIFCSRKIINIPWTAFYFSSENFDQSVSLADYLYAVQGNRRLKCILFGAAGISEMPQGYTQFIKKIIGQTGQGKISAVFFRYNITREEMINVFNHKWQYNYTIKLTNSLLIRQLLGCRIYSFFIKVMITLTEQGLTL